MLEKPDFVGRGLDEALDYILVGEKVRTLDCVPLVQIEVVAFLRAHDRGGSAFGTDRVRAHDMHLGDDSNVRPTLGLNADFNRCSKSREPGS